MFARTFFATVLAVAATVSASAIPHNETSTFQKRAVTTINQCTVSGQVALTFDDGPFQWQQNIKNSMNGGKATFFLNGNNYGCIYDRAEDIKNAYYNGHTMGSHGWSHAHMGQLSWDQVHDELWRVEQAFIKILGLKPLYFRPPYGEVSDTLYAALENRGYKKVFLWSDDSGDSTGASAQSSKNLYNSIANTFPQPHLVLNHETYSSTVFDVLPYAVGRLQGAGYKLVAVDTCLGSGGEFPYVKVGEPQARDSTWHC